MAVTYSAPKFFLYTDNLELVEGVKRSGAQTQIPQVGSEIKLNIRISPRLIEEFDPDALIIDLDAVPDINFKKMHLIGLVCACAGSRTLIVVVAEEERHRELATEWVNEISAGSVHTKVRIPLTLHPKELLRCAPIDIIKTAKEFLEQQGGPK